ncbi:MAG: Basic proline-rich protein [Bryobacterales bacterium]|nr:Basic proline-rich protein [Bryobacterales bacterium]
MGNVSFLDRFELLDLLREDEVQTFRARERATGRDVEAHLVVSSPQLVANLDNLSEAQRRSVLDRGRHEGKLYVVTTPLAGGFREWLAADHAPLDSAGAWRIRPQEAPAPSEPGDFTRMFKLRQAPEPVAAPASQSTQPAQSMSQPGEFTRAFQRPGTAASMAPADSPAPGQPGDFTRMFQKPAPPDVPEPLTPASQPRGRSILIAVILLSAIAVFLLMRRLY